MGRPSSEVCFTKEERARWEKGEDFRKEMIRRLPVRVCKATELPQPVSFRLHSLILDTQCLFVCLMISSLERQFVLGPLITAPHPPDLSMTLITLVATTCWSGMLAIKLSKVSLRRPSLRRLHLHIGVSLLTTDMLLCAFGAVGQTNHL